MILVSVYSWLQCSGVGFSCQCTRGFGELVQDSHVSVLVTLVLWCRILMSVYSWLWCSGVGFSCQCTRGFSALV